MNDIIAIIFKGVYDVMNFDIKNRHTYVIRIKLSNLAKLSLKVIEFFK